MRLNEVHTEPILVHGVTYYVERPRGMRRPILGIMIALLLFSMFELAFNVKLTKARAYVIVS